MYSNSVPTKVVNTLETLLIEATSILQHKMDLLELLSYYDGLEDENAVDLITMHLAVLDHRLDEIQAKIKDKR